MVHDISQGGLLIESDQRFALGDSIQVDLPEAGAVQAEVVWSSGSFVGCRFARELPSAVVSAALLRSPPVEGEPVRIEASPSTATEVRELQARIQQLLRVEVDPGSSTAPAREAAFSPAADQEEEAPSDDRLSFAWRMRIILGASLACWALIVWFAAVT